MTIKLKNYELKNFSSPFIVAEAGINHNGEIEKAFEMIKVVKESGAHAIKFQTFKASEFVGDPDQTYTYKSQGKDVTESMLKMFERYEFSESQWQQIKNKCDAENVLFLSTPQNLSDLKLLLKLGIPAIKVGSDDFTNVVLIKEYIKTKLPLILSCGMADEAEVDQTLKASKALKGYPVILLLCTSQYPTPAQDTNLLKFKTLQKKYPKLTLGFSDHTQGPMASSLAVGFGACFFEKHFTLDQNLPGPDHWFSENPQGLKEWVSSIKTAYQMLGTPEIKPTQKEIEMRTLARRSIIALKDINQNEKLTLENIGLKRPGNGLPPSQFEKVVGKISAHHIKKGNLLKKGDFK